MGTHWGNEGVVKIGSVTIAEVTEFEFTQSVAPADNTSLGKAWKTHIPNSGIKEWAGSLTCQWDETDTTGQGALAVGASVTVNLYPGGASSGDKMFSGLVSITEVTMTTPAGSETIKRSFKFMGNGALTETTVA